MKLADHVESLLRQGHRPKELIELGFSKNIVTRMSRKLRAEKASKSKANITRAIQTNVESLKEPPPQESASLQLAKFEERLKIVETLAKKITDLEARLGGTPLLGIRQRFQCQCGATGLVAVHVKCTVCNRETYLGWWPEKTATPKQ